MAVDIGVSPLCDLHSGACALYPMAPSSLRYLSLHFLGSIPENDGLGDFCVAVELCLKDSMLCPVGSVQSTAGASMSVSGH